MRVESCASTGWDIQVPETQIYAQIVVEFYLYILLEVILKSKLVDDHAFSRGMSITLAKKFMGDEFVAFCKLYALTLVCS